MSDNNKQISFEIVREIGIISRIGKNWTRELNLVGWNGNKAKYEIRDWDETRERMGKAAKLTEKELRRLKELIDEELALLDEQK